MKQNLFFYSYIYIYNQSLYHTAAQRINLKELEHALVSLRKLIYYISSRLGTVVREFVTLVTVTVTTLSKHRGAPVHGAFCAAAQYRMGAITNGSTVRCVARLHIRHLDR